MASFPSGTVQQGVQNQGRVQRAGPQAIPQWKYDRAAQGLPVRGALGRGNIPDWKLDRAAAGQSVRGVPTQEWSGAQAPAGMGQPMIQRPPQPQVQNPPQVQAPLTQPPGQPAQNPFVQAPQWGQQGQWGQQNNPFVQAPQMNRKGGAQPSPPQSVYY